MLPTNMLQVFAFLTVLNYGYCFNDNLKGIIFIVKHGQKSLEYTYPNDPYQGEDYWPDGYAQLTIKGKQRMYAIGEQIRQRYGENLPINPHQVYVTSFDNGPCLESGAQLTAGAFPPQGRWKWSQQLNWQPFPIHTRPVSQDNVFSPIHSCPKTREELRKLEESNEMRKFMENNKQLISYIEFKSGIERLSFHSIVNIYDALTVERNLPLPLPSWINETITDFIETLYSHLMYKYYSSASCKALLAGPLLEKITENLKNIEHNSENSEKVFIYSGKESNLISLLAALEINTTKLIVPSFGSVMAIEVLKNDNKQPNLQMQYLDGEEISEWQTLKLNNCNTICPLLNFYSIESDLISRNWTQDCTVLKEDIKTLIPNSGDKKETHTLLIISMGILIVSLVFVLIYFVIKRRKRVDYIII